MSFPGLSQSDMRNALGEMEQALFHHEQWCEALTRTLLCNLSPDERDLDQNAHCKCQFGQWLYGTNSHTVSSHPSFAEIKNAHQRMHRSATEMLIISRQRQPIPLTAYERFKNALEQMRLEVTTTKHELEEAIYNIDPLTSVSNRIGMLTKFREQQSLVQRTAHSCCLAMMDLDCFKRVNDTYGHPAGDHVLVTFARHIMARLRPYDMLFRYGGEEFLICTPNTDLKSGYDAVERLRAGLAAIAFDSDSGSSFYITASFGITLLDPDVPVEQSIARADRALLAAKAAGRNRAMVWDASMTENGLHFVPETSTAPLAPSLPNTIADATAANR